MTIVLEVCTMQQGRYSYLTSGSTPLTPTLTNIYSIGNIEAMRGRHSCHAELTLYFSMTID